MSIIGLGQTQNCVHTPLPVTVTNRWQPPYVLEMRVIDPVNTADLVRPPKLYGNPDNETYYIDVAPWVRQGMAKLQNTNIYRVTPQTIADDYTKQLIVRFQTPSGSFEQVTTTFSHCALERGYRAFDTPFDNIRVWKCYPFSWIDGGNRHILIPSTDTAPVVPGTFVEYDTSCCQGTFVKWLNEYGFYNYWLFPTNHKGLERTAEEIYRIPRNIFRNPDKTSNVDTAGFVPTEKLTVRDIVLKRFWPLMKSLVASPEVYILREEWEIGTTVTPDEWIQVIQTDASFERSDFGRSATELEIEFELPNIYTQTRL